MSSDISEKNNIVDSVWNLNNFDHNNFGNVDALLLNSIRSMYQEVSSENEDEIRVFEENKIRIYNMLVMIRFPNLNEKIRCQIYKVLLNITPQNLYEERIPEF